MKFGALALDYDGTIAKDGVLHPDVRAAIGEVRQRGVVVVLVTGRQLTDLRRLAGDLTCFDAVVAENGCVLDFPASGRHVLLAHPPRADFVHELRQRSIDIAVGEVLIEADAKMASAVLEVIRSREQPLVLAFNRGRVMILPQAVGKSTGLRQALFALRVSIHNTVGIGDAENDHDMLDACEVGVAVCWGSLALQAMADQVIEGIGPAAVAAYIRKLSGQTRLAAEQMGRRRLLLGYQHDGGTVSLAVRGRSILIAGEPGTGKSWLAGLLCEQLILQGYCVCVIDPEGDYRTLEDLPGVIRLGGDDPPPPARELTRALQHADVSVIIDLSKLSTHDKREYVTMVLPLLMTLRRRTGLPHKILLDEAHYFLAGADSCRCIDPELAGYILVTYRISALESSIRLATDAVVMVTRETDPSEADALRMMCRPPSAMAAPLDVLRTLATNEAALLPGADEAHDQVRRFQVAPRLTAHVRHQIKYFDMPVAEDHAFVFTANGRPGPRVRTLKTLTGLLVTSPRDQVDGHLRRHDVSRWIDDVFRDHPLAVRLRGIETRIDTDDGREVAHAMAQTIRARYETPDK